jgi:hypothetical protein
MTQDEIIRMAVKCQLLTTSNRDGLYAQALEAFAELVAEKEREACAKLLETTDLGGLKNNPAMQSWVANMLLAYVEAIRARGQA